MSRKFIPPIIPKLAEPERFYASAVYHRIQKLINERQATLADNELIAITILLLDGGRINVENFGYQNPNFITVQGTLEETDSPIEAWLSHTNIQLLISVICPENFEPTKPRKTIGFRGENLATQD